MPVAYVQSVAGAAQSKRQLRGRMEFIQLLFLVVYLGTPVFIVYWSVRLARSNRATPMSPTFAAFGLWLLQAGVLLYFIFGCIGGHCRLTPLEENGPVVLMVCAYVGIAWLLWFAWKQSVNGAK